MKKLYASVKLLSLFGGIAVIAMVNNIAILVLMLAGFSVIAFSIQRTFFVERVKLLFFIGLGIMLFQLLFNQTDVIMTRISICLITAIRISNVSILLFIIMKILSASEILLLIYFLPRNIQLIIMMTFSLMPVIMQEQENVVLMQKSRGMTNNILQHFKSFFAIIIPLMHRVLHRADTISLTIASRGYE